MTLIKKITFIITCTTACTLPTSKAAGIDLQNPKHTMLALYGVINFSLGFWANFVTYNTKQQKIVGNLAGLGLAACINCSQSAHAINKVLSTGIATGSQIAHELKNQFDLTSKSFNQCIQDSLIPIATAINKQSGSFISSQTYNPYAHAAVALGCYTAGGFCGALSRKLFDDSCAYLEATYHALAKKFFKKKLSQADFNAPLPYDPETQKFLEDLK